MLVWHWLFHGLPKMIAVPVCAWSLPKHFIWLADWTWL